jgi:hypothetical protein
LIGKKGNGLDALTQIFPILFGCSRSGKSTSQSDYRDVGIPPWTTHFDASTTAGTGR